MTLNENQIVKEVSADGVSFYFTLRPNAGDLWNIDIVREDFERAFFCVKRALAHLKGSNHGFTPLTCDGCKEIALFLTEPGYRGDEHNPVGVDFERPY